MSDLLLGLRNVPKELRWRGPLRFSLLVLRECFSPLLYWHILYVFEKDVDPPEADKITEFEVRVYSGLEHMRRLGSEIPPMGEISADVIERRIVFGDTVAVAYAENNPIGYAWMTVGSGSEVAFDTVWVLRAREAIFHGSFTLPSWRGRGVQHQLDAVLQRCARKNGISEVFATISAFNTPSLNAFKKTRLRKNMTLILVRIRFFNWVYRKAIGAPFESRFAVETRSAPRSATV